MGQVAVQETAWLHLSGLYLTTQVGCDTQSDFLQLPVEKMPATGHTTQEQKCSFKCEHCTHKIFLTFFAIKPPRHFSFVKQASYIL